MEYVRRPAFVRMHDRAGRNLSGTRVYRMDGGSTGLKRAGLFFGRGLIRTVVCTGNSRFRPYAGRAVPNAAAKRTKKEKKHHGKQQEHDPHPSQGLRSSATILRAVHKYKDSREQFERRTHKRLIDIMSPTQKTVEALMNLEVPAGVEIEIKL